MTERAAQLLELVKAEAAELPHAPEGLELFRWIHARGWHDCLVFLPKREAAAIRDADPGDEREVKTQRIYRAFSVQISSSFRVWVGWDAEERLAAAWLDPVLGEAPTHVVHA